MKYFTPDLLARFGSSDEAVADAAEELWDQKQKEYKKYLQSIWQELPPGVKKLLKRFYLHDARVLTVARDERQSVSIFLRLDGVDGPGDGLVELKYKLEGQIKVIRQQEAPSNGAPLKRWLYDEMALVSGEGPRIFLHSILFSGGWELQIPFSRLSCIRLRQFVSPDAEGIASKLEELAVA
jgi:hypothetical protein